MGRVDGIKPLKPQTSQQMAVVPHNGGLLIFFHTPDSSLQHQILFKSQGALAHPSWSSRCRTTKRSKTRDPHTAQQRFTMSYVAQISSRFLLGLHSSFVQASLHAEHLRYICLHLALKAAGSWSLIFSEHLASLLYIHIRKYVYIYIQFLCQEQKALQKLKWMGCDEHAKFVCIPFTYHTAACLKH